MFFYENVEKKLFFQIKLRALNYITEWERYKVCKVGHTKMAKSEFQIFFNNLFFEKSTKIRAKQRSLLNSV